VGDSHAVRPTATMPKVIFISRAPDGQTQLPATPVVARFIPGALAKKKTAGDGLAHGRFLRTETAGEAGFFLIASEMLAVD
jgi:hypothetical protein